MVISKTCTRRGRPSLAGPCRAGRLFECLPRVLMPSPTAKYRADPTVPLRSIAAPHALSFTFDLVHSSFCLRISSLGRIPPFKACKPEESRPDKTNDACTGADEIFCPSLKICEVPLITGACGGWCGVRSSLLLWSCVEMRDDRTLARRSG